jgi:hypothetical protein
VSYRGGRSTVVSLPTTFPPPQNGGSALWLEPAPSGMESHCVALVRGEWGYVEPLWPGKSLSFGRQERFLSALRVMDGLGFVTVDPNSNIPLGDKLGLSRKALSMQVEGDQLLVKLLSTAQIAYHLDQDRKLVAKLSSNDGDATTAKLEPGHHIALAHYLFRFDAMGR